MYLVIMLPPPSVDIASTVTTFGAKMFSGLTNVQTIIVPLKRGNKPIGWVNV